MEITAIMRFASAATLFALMSSATAFAQQRNASPDITTQIIKQPDTMTCQIYNNSNENICVVYDVYPVWSFSQPARGTVLHTIPGKTALSIAWAFPSQQASMRCKLVSARYVRWNYLCQ
jgi:hypothetical protein